MNVKKAVSGGGPTRSSARCSPHHTAQQRPPLPCVPPRTRLRHMTLFTAILCCNSHVCAQANVFGKTVVPEYSPTWTALVFQTIILFRY